MLKDVEIVKVKEHAHDDLRYFEKVIKEMSGEIQVVLTKNKMLED